MAIRKVKMEVVQIWKESINKTAEHLSSAECVTWTALLIIELVAIVTINVLAIIIFIRKRNVRRRSTYLLINLTVADMLVGALTGPKHVYNFGVWCDFWYDKLRENPTSLLVIDGIDKFFLGASLINITTISLERLHATFRPLRHRVAAKKWIYGVVIFASWCIVTLVVIGTAISWSKISSVILNSFVPAFLFVIIISNILILIKVRLRSHPQRHGATSREKKLTVTLVIVTAVSLLMWLPFVTRRFFQKKELYNSLSYYVHVRIYFTVEILLFVNSLVNPVLYVIRMPEFKRALLALVCKTNSQRIIPGIPLRNQ